MTTRDNHVDELISASLTGDLTDAERVELDAHLVRCETCRATLAAFTAERRILSGLPVADPPRDLSARVRTGIETGVGHPWWRRSGLIAIGASLATVATAILAVVVFSNFDFGPVGQQSGSPVASVSLEPGPSAVETSPPTEAPTPLPAFALGPGELGYLSLTGAPLVTPNLSLINDASGGSIDLGLVSGPAVAASLSPDGQWLAYITQKGETGANEVWALHLSDGSVSHLGCSAAAPFTDRLAWSPDSLFVGYTLVAIDLGATSGCETPEGALGSADAWAWDVRTDAPRRLTTTGDAYSASFLSTGAAGLMYVSQAAGEPSSKLVSVDGTVIRDLQEPLEGVFLPLLSPDGNRALFWNGTMAQSPDGTWEFSRGGLPRLSGDFRSTEPGSPWLGTALFTDLVPVGGEAFVSGRFTWGPDSDLIAFWDGAWTGAPQSAGGDYPSRADVLVGRMSTGLLSATSQLGLVRPSDAFIVDVTFSSDGTMAAVTIGLLSAGIGDPPSAYLEIVPLDGSSPYTVGGGVEPPPWNGPAVFGY
jgi:hypothetical protein